MSWSSAASHDRSRAAIATRRNETGGAAKTEVAKRARKLVAHRENLKRRRKDVEKDLNAARVLESDGKETFSKFRACCNTASKLKDKDDVFINYLGFEDRWSNDHEYRSRPSTLRDIPDKNAALHRDSQAALYFQDDFMSPYDPNVQIKELLMMARIWIRRRADEHAEKQEALTRAWVKAENDGIATPDLSKSGFDMLCKMFKTKYPGCEEHAWYKKFKSQFEEIRVARRATERQAEEDRVEQAKVRNEARKAKLTTVIET